MITVLWGSQWDEHPDICNQMFRLRAQLFLDRRGWSVDVSGGLEIDRFDDLDPLYVCVLSAEGRLVASLRLLPTLGPHMLSDVFPEVAGARGPIRGADVWESSRFCVDTEAARDFHADGINHATRMLLAGLFASARTIGLRSVVSVYDVYVERILKRAGCSFERLGPVHEYDALRTVAGLFPVADNEPARILRGGGHRTAPRADGIAPAPAATPRSRLPHPPAIDAAFAPRAEIPRPFQAAYPA
ncbi:acyl-homoserine-lactone synthase [Salinarimonas chemoclinalis]|uniref:acyl-homoserine-lactone synthase n=1 Tax=Salinarimonas chemoclinalis TaxID=3241599 RepID=UPI00355670D3